MSSSCRLQEKFSASDATLAAEDWFGGQGGLALHEDMAFVGSLTMEQVYVSVGPTLQVWSAGIHIPSYAAAHLTMTSMARAFLSSTCTDRVLAWHLLQATGA